MGMSAKVYFAFKKRQANRPKQLYHPDVKRNAWYPLRVMDLHDLAEKGRGRCREGRREGGRERDRKR